MARRRPGPASRGATVCSQIYAHVEMLGLVEEVGVEVGVAPRTPARARKIGPRWARARPCRCTGSRRRRSRPCRSAARAGALRSPAPGGCPPGRRRRAADPRRRRTRPAAAARASMPGEADDRIDLHVRCGSRWCRRRRRDRARRRARMRMSSTVKCALGLAGHADRFGERALAAGRDATRQAAPCRDGRGRRRSPARRIGRPRRSAAGWRRRRDRRPRPRSRRGFPRRRGGRRGQAGPPRSPGRTAPRPRGYATLGVVPSPARPRRAYTGHPTTAEEAPRAGIRTGAHMRGRGGGGSVGFGRAGPASALSGA